MMATFFGSPPFLSHPISRTNHHLSSSSSTPPPSLPPQPPSSQPPVQPVISQSSPQEEPSPVSAGVSYKTKTKARSSAESTDWIASSLTRRFGLGAGLAWAGFLAFGVVSEQIKTRLEVSQEAANTRDVEKEEEVVLPNGLRYYELRVGGGTTPRRGDLVVINLKGSVVGNGTKGGAFVDTFSGENRALALVMGSRPYGKGMCEGVEMVLRSMKSGGKRRVIVPPSLGFGEQGADLGPGSQIPPHSTLEYIIEVEKVSIAPA